MRFWLIILGLIIGAAGYLIGETIGLGVMGVGALLILIGLFSKKKQYYAGQSYGNQRMMMNNRPDQPLNMQKI